MSLIKIFALSLLSVSVAYAHDDVSTLPSNDAATPTSNSAEATPTTRAAPSNSEPEPALTPPETVGEEMNTLDMLGVPTNPVMAEKAVLPPTPAPLAETHKLELFAGLGLRALHGAKAYPAARLPGVLEAGSARSDQRGDGLDYAEIGARAQFSPKLLGQVNLARHGGKGGTNDVDQAWLNFNTDRAAAIVYASRVGRQLVPIGFLNLKHAHSRDFGNAPLTLRAMVNDAWRADGMRFDAALGQGFEAGIGAWLNQGFPGTVSNTPNMASARLAWSNSQLKLEVDYVHTAINQRALSTVGTGGHTHTVPTCTVASATLVCLQGVANLWTLAGRWQAHPDSIWFGAEYWNKRETGILRSNFGAPDYQGDLNGGWLEIGYPVLPTLDILARSEKLVAKHQLNGINAALVANQAGITNATQPLSSQALALRWTPYHEHQLSAEWAQENLGTTNQSVYLLRYQMEFSVGVL